MTVLGLKYIPNVTTLRLDTDKCNGCRMCIYVCPHAVFNVEDKKAFIVARDACMECGACAQNCPEGAISVRSGVGCAYAIILGSIRGSEPTCGCPDDPSCC
jgi:NAD-dependent dihydropyrimidine dehydrogenase PreA subunit